MLVFCFVIAACVLHGTECDEKIGEIAGFAEWAKACQAMVDVLERDPLMKADSTICQPDEKQLAALEDKLRNLKDAAYEKMKLMAWKEDVESIYGITPTMFHTMYSNFQRRLSSPVGNAIGSCEELRTRKDHFGEPASDEYLNKLMPKIREVVHGLRTELNTLVVETELDTMEKEMEEELDRKEEAVSSGFVEKCIKKIGEIDHELKKETRKCFCPEAPFHNAKNILLEMQNSKTPKEYVAGTIAALVAETKVGVLEKEMNAKMAPLTEENCDRLKFEELDEIFVRGWNEAAEKIVAMKHLAGTNNTEKTLRQKMEHLREIVTQKMGPIKKTLLTMFEKAQMEAVEEFRRIDGELEQIGKDDDIESADVRNRFTQIVADAKKCYEKLMATFGWYEFWERLWRFRAERMDSILEHVKDRKQHKGQQRQHDDKKDGSVQTRRKKRSKINTDWMTDVEYVKFLLKWDLLHFEYTERSLNMAKWNLEKAFNVPKIEEYEGGERKRNRKPADGIQKTLVPIEVSFPFPMKQEEDEEQQEEAKHEE